uniref:Thioredoxin domain-containing protein 9 n=1 Tax=Panagrellus redivivus TaxID=6233 RepID=A0A7E4UV21_PANRE
MTDQLIAQKLLAAAQVVEKQIDAEIERLDQLDDDDLEVIRQRRIAEMKAATRKRQDQEAAGHGKVTELGDERDFFEAGKKSDKLVVHFYDPTNRRCQHVDYCFEKLAPAHFGTKFVKINTEKVPFLVKRLNVRFIPSICVILDNKIKNYLRIGNDVDGKTDEQALLAHVEKWLLNETAIEKLTVTRGSKH